MVKIGKTTINPSKIVCLGRNYLDHIKETNAPIPTEPVFFVKTLNTLITDNEPIIYPKILYSADVAFDYIQGYTVFLDMTARTMQKSDRNINLPWFRSKNFDTFGPIGPRIVPCSEISDPHNLSIQLKVNGQTRQSSNTRHMLFKIPQTLEYLSKFVTLKRGDIIATGTPSGISPIQPGDIIEASIEKIGTITHKVLLEQ